TALSGRVVALWILLVALAGITLRSRVPAATGHIALRRFTRLLRGMVRGSLDIAAGGGQFQFLAAGTSHGFAGQVFADRVLLLALRTGEANDHDRSCPLLRNDG